MASYTGHQTNLLNLGHLSQADTSRYTAVGRRLLSCRHPQDAREIAMQIDRERGSVFIWREDNLLDKPADQLGGFLPMFRFIERGNQPLNLDMVAVRHVRMDKDRRFRLRVEHCLQLQPSFLKPVDLVSNEVGIDAIFDSFHKLRDRAVGAFKLGAIGVERSAVFHAQAIHMLSVFDAKHLAEFRLHEPSPQRAEHGFFQFAFADREATEAGSLVPRRRASVLRGGHLGEAAAALTALQKEGEELPRATLRSMIALLGESLLT